MSALDAWLEGVEQIETDEVVPSRDLLTDEALTAYGASRKALFAQRAERAGLDLDDINEAIAVRSEESVNLCVARMIVTQGDALDEIRLIVRSMSMQWFLLGVLWEQARQLPDLTA